MSLKLIITEYKNRIFSMLTKDQREIRLELYDAEEKAPLDSVYVARVRDIQSNIGAAFVEISPKEVCYFSLKENPDPIFLNPKNTAKVCQGDRLLVQLKKTASKSKYGMVSSKITLAGKYLALTREQAGSVGVSRKIKDRGRCEALKALLMPYVNGDYGFIVRTDAGGAENEDILSEVQNLKTEYEEILQTAKSRSAFTVVRKAEAPLLKDIRSYRLTGEDEIVTDAPEIYEELSSCAIEAPVRLYEDNLLPLIKLYDMERRLEMALRPRVWLKSGGYLVIEPTEALTVIDVNTGRYDGRQDREQTFLKTNLEACDEIARQLILRNLSGIVIVDFINLTEPSDMNIVERRMRGLLADDPVKAVFIEFTKLGLMEITRKKIKKPLCEAVEAIYGGD